MKRIFSILLCLVLMLSITACQPDNIKYPADIVDPNQTEQENVEQQVSKPEEDKGESKEEAPAEPAPEEESKEEKPEEPAPETESKEETAPETESKEEKPEESAPEKDPKEETPVEEPTKEESKKQPNTDDPAKEANAEATVEKSEKVKESKKESADTAEKEDKQDAEEKTEELPEEPPVLNPLTAEDFVPATTIAGSLQPSGIIKPGSAVSALKNRTITLYTADDQYAFSYTNEHGKPVSEWEWMEQLAIENGFMLKRQVKNRAISLKAQRTALFAGQKLSLIQIAANELGNGMTLATSSKDLLNLEVPSYGISKAVLEQSDYKLFAPIGNADTLWYNTTLMPTDTDPQTMSTNKEWTVEQFKKLCNTGNEGALALLMEDLLPWATLGGRSPLTLLDGKLDSNLYAKVTRNAWTSIKTIDLGALCKIEGEGEYNLDKGNTLFAYTNTPQTAEGLTLKYAPLPTLEKDTAGTVTFAGTFLALPKYETDNDTLRAALTFAELWCNRYTEARAATLQALGIKGTDYQTYCDMTETQGMLIFYTPEIQKAAEAYLSGITDPKVDMEKAYDEVRPTIEALIAARNLYY